MKTTIILIVALLFNTSLLLAEPLLVLVKEIDPIVLISIEALLIILFAIHKFLNDFSKCMKIDFDGLEVFVYKKKRR
ncbi:hypothetical protein [Zobellia alginiliquefaciens]|uniref:hypothetical protein n=1 Tax=Zobellia alginiliquefaciens TaxID=3032586 RepID=UPI0023E3F82A|nr:hypothetical protein [Zobellia alginiliquefaciens]